MIIIKKVLIIFFLVIILSGCTKNNNAVNEVKKYLDSYIDLDDEVLVNINSIINKNDEFNNNNKKMYKKIFLKQYKDLKYNIIKEEYSDNKALVTVNINVYDLNKIEQKAVDYLSANLKEFYNDDDTFDNDKYISYKLNLMYDSNERTSYEIIFLLEKKNNTWMLIQPNDEDLEKLHGIYNE